MQRLLIWSLGAIAGCSGALTAGGSGVGAGNGGPPGGSGGLPGSDGGPGVADAGGTPTDGQVPPGPDGGGPPPSSAYFPIGAPWTKDVSGANGVVSPSSNDIIAWLAANGGWGNGNKFQIDLSFDILQADSSTPRLPFSQGANYTLPDCDGVASLPVPTVGAIEGMPDYNCSDLSQNDCHLLIVDHGAQRLYEMNQTLSAVGRVTAGCLVIWDLSRIYPPSGRGDQCTSADAAGFPIAPLLFTADEVAAGHIDHAVRFALPNERMRAGLYLHPGSHGGAPSAPAPAPIYASHFRLRQNYPVSTLPTVAARVIATALQRYGMFLADGGQIALMGTNDRFTSAKWDGLMGSTHDLYAIQVTDFEVLDFDTPIPLTYDCVRNP